MDSIFVLDRVLLSACALHACLRAARKQADRSEVEVSGYLIVESLVGALLIIEEEVVGQSPIEVGDGLVGLEIEVFVFDGAPEAFDEYVVQSPPFAVHADADAFPLQSGGEAGGGELGALVGVEDVGLADLPVRAVSRTQTGGERFVQGVQAEVGLQRVGDAPGQDIPAKPVHHGHQIHKALWHWHVGDIGAPDLIGPINREASQQVGIPACAQRAGKDAMPRVRLAGAGTRENGF